MIYRVWPRAAISQNTSMISSLLSIHPLPPCLMSSSSKNLVELLSEQWPRPRGRLLRLLWHLDSAASSPLFLLLTVAVMDPNGLSSNTIRAHVLMTEPSAEKQFILLRILDPIKIKTHPRGSHYCRHEDTGGRGASGTWNKRSCS